MRGRRVAAAALATVGLLLLPGAIMANWATTQLVETERFVATLAPLADDPAVHDRIITEVTALVDEQVDIDAVTSELLSGLGEALDLGPKAQGALDLVSAPIAAGVRSLVADVVTEVVTSPAFSTAWKRSIEVAHTQAIRLLSGAPDSLLTLDRDGTLSLPLGPIVAEVRAALVEQGVPFAAAIPDTDRAIVLAELPNLALARVVFQVGVTVGLWLPWITAALLIGAVLVAPRRPATARTIAIVALGVAAVLALGFVLARVAIAAYVGPESSALARSVFDAMTSYAVSTILGMLALSIVIVLAAWWLGSSALAEKGRAALDARVAQAREALGIGPSGFGAALHRRRGVARGVAVVLAALPAVLLPPLSIVSVLVCALLAAGLLVVVELLAVAPPPPPPPPPPPAPAPAPAKRASRPRATASAR
ncbi:hypothetical protein [Microcella sp.]|uniref:hypothetical protein n=1 Tax=Microcella sp. TaxID=1913979 RepID=UPI00299F746D|nr:hypothetical protein [Microcella sp.]MDX2025278.1 hypothetical protein [Microcella sp.]